MSFNVRGEPIVCSPRDAYASFARTGMDALVIGPFLVDRVAQSEQVLVAMGSGAMDLD